jgi:sterol desaturase/sphingolipid hydroxylase (fatty acid hydroxylase superfamily)
MKLLLILVFGLSAAGLSIRTLEWAGNAARTRKYLIADDPKRSVGEAELSRSFRINSLVSLTLVFGLTFLLRDRLFYERATPLWMMALEAAAVILLYDFAYYFVHRFLFHEWSLLRSVHAVHHAAQNPRVVDSFLLHPLETAIGLVLMLASILVLGGIHLYTFAPIFAAYTTLNVFNHAGLNVPHFPLRTLGALAVKHDKHHHSMLSGNYASITPLPDIIFGTVE